MKNILEYNGYHAKIEYSADDNVFVGYVIGINDSLSFYGTSIDELREQFEICIDDYLDMCKHFGKEPDKEYKGSFNVRIPSEMHRDLELMAISKETSINNLVVQAINGLLNNEYKTNTVERMVFVMPVPIKEPQKLCTESGFDITRDYIDNNPMVNEYSVSLN